MAQRLVSLKRATIYASANFYKASTRAEVQRLQKREPRGASHYIFDKTKKSTDETTNQIGFIIKSPTFEVHSLGAIYNGARFLLGMHEWQEDVNHAPEAYLTQ
jgi:hypothetical protein